MTERLFERELLAVSDPLTDRARKARSWLLLCALLGLAVTQVGLLPTKVAALGLEFSTANRSSIVLLLAVVTAYFFVTFTVYAIADYAAWHLRRVGSIWEEDRAAFEEHRKSIVDESKLSEEQRELLEEHGRHIGRMWRGGNFTLKEDRLKKIAPFLGLCTSSIEFWLPPILGVVSLAQLARLWVNLHGA